MGSVQRTVEIANTDSRDIKYDNDNRDDIKDCCHKDLSNMYFILKKNFDKYRQSRFEIKDKMETEIENMKNELGKISKILGHKMEDTFSQAILSDIERLDEEYRNLKLTLNGYKTKYEVVERRAQD